MSQHVPETCNESGGTWLPLIEYSVKSGISLSTIRRKIKSNSIPYRLENGRYLILYQEKGGKRVPQRTYPNSGGFGYTTDLGKARPPAPAARPVAALEEREDAETVQMLCEAFEHALREKDERIQLLEKVAAELEERVNELRLLVRVLEEKYEVRY